MSQPLISVVISCYNSQAYLRLTLDSVCSQSLSDFEVVVVDDCSTDNTPAILAEYAARDTRFVVIRHEKNQGRPAFTKTTALKQAKGKYVCFLDHDDLFHPEKLRLTVELLEKHTDCIAAFHDVELIDAKGSHLSRYLDGFVKEAADFLVAQDEGEYITTSDFFKFQSIHYAALHTISAMVCPERLPVGVLKYDTQYQVCDDTDLWIRLGLCGQIAYLDSVLAYYRQHSSNITCDQSKLDRDAVRLMKNNYKRVAPIFNADERKKLRQRIANTLADHGWRSRCSGRHSEASQAYLGALYWEFRTDHAINVLKAFLPTRPDK